MVRTRVYIFWAIAVCLSACLCVSADATDKKEEAENAVEGVQELARTALNNAKNNHKEANSMLSRVNSHKKNAEDAVLQVQESSNGNSKAEAVAAEVIKTTETIVSMYANAKTAAEAAVQSMGELVARAEAVNKEANIDVVPDSETSDEYTQIHKKVSEVTAKVKSVEDDLIEEIKNMQPASTQELDMSDLVEKVKVGKYHIYVIISASKIETVLEKADVDIAATEQKRDEVGNTLQEMKDLSKNAPEKLTVYVNTVLRNTEGLLVSATKAVEAAKKAKEDMIALQKSAEASLAKFEGASDAEQVNGEVENAKRYAEETANKAPEIADALQSAEISATNAESNKRAFMRTLSTSNTPPDGAGNRVTNKPETPAEDGTKKPTGKDSNQPSDKKPETPVDDGTKKPTDKGSDPTSDNKPGNPVNDGKKNPAGNGGTSTVDGDNDSAITVSISLLLAFIACVALHR